MFKRDENGAIVVEATLSLSAFIFLFFMIFSIITSARCQAIIGVAVDNSAKEISQYSYLYGLTGIHDSVHAALETSTDDQINDVISNVNDLYNNISSVAQTAGETIGATTSTGLNADQVSSKWQNLANQITTLPDSLSGSASNIKNQLESICENPKEFMFGIAKILANGALSVAKSRLIAEPVARVLVKKHLKTDDSDDVNYRCFKLGVMKGSYLGSQSYFNGLDFSRSMLFPNNGDEIDIICNYQIQMIKLLNVDIRFELTQQGKTKAWFKGDGSVLTKAGAQQAANTASEKVAEMADSLWAQATDYNELYDYVRHMGMADLNASGNYTLSGGNASNITYNPSSNRFTMLAPPLNPLYGGNEVSDVKQSDVQAIIEKYAATIHAQTDTSNVVDIKKPDAQGNVITDSVSVKNNKELVVIITIPEDPGLKEIVEKAIKDANTRGVKFEINQSYGCMYQ